MDRIGRAVEKQFGKPKAILMVSAHWYTHGTFVQSARNPGRSMTCMGSPRNCIR